MLWWKWRFLPKVGIRLIETDFFPGYGSKTSGWTMWVRLRRYILFTFEYSIVLDRMIVHQPEYKILFRISFTSLHYVSTPRKTSSFPIHILLPATYKRHVRYLRLFFTCQSVISTKYVSILVIRSAMRRWHYSIRVTEIAKLSPAFCYLISSIDVFVLVRFPHI